ncbi:MAG: hypothetical protein EXS64_08300 [Candidatus Latescibacteria bacterium]|nr:hypothetical protein [Candidatus Latescibacterota bacterium]
MKVAGVTAHRLKECAISVEKRALFTKWKTSEEWIDDETFGKKWVSPTCLLYNPSDGLVYVGMAALDGNIFYSFDPRTGSWTSLNYPAGRDRYASEIHQSLLMDDVGCIYGAVATLGDVDVWPKAPGGQLFRYDPGMGRYEFLCIPIPHDYVQGIILDRKRGILYGNTFPGRKLFRYDIANGKVRELTMLGNVLPEYLVLDADGGVWHHYEMFQWAGRHPLLRYDPDRDEVEFLNLDLPDLMSGIRAGSQMETALLTRDGTLYLGSRSGALMTLDHRRRKIAYLGKPFPFPRMKGLIEGPDGLIYGVCGTEYDVHLFTYNRSSGLFKDLGPIVDDRDGTRCWMAHHMCAVDPRTFILAESHNHERASFLFQVTLSTGLR